MKAIHILAAFALAVLFTSCGQITSTQLIGEPLNLEETKEFDGQWKLNDSRAYAASSANGEIQLKQITSLEVSEEQAAVFVTRLDDDLFIHVQEPAELNPSYYFAHLVKENNDSYHVFLPRFQVFKDAAAQQKLQGEVAGFSEKLHLSGASDQLDNFIREKGVAELFEVESSILLHKEN